MTEEKRPNNQVHQTYTSRLEKWILENYKIGDAISIDDIKNNYYKEYEDIPREEELNRLIKSADNYKEKEPYLEELKKIRNRHENHTKIIKRDFLQLFLKGLAKRINCPINFAVLKGHVPREDSFKDVEKRYVKSWNQREEDAKSPNWFGGPYPNGYYGHYSGEIVLITRTARKIYGETSNDVKSYPLNSLLYCGTDLCMQLAPREIRLMHNQSLILVEKFRYYWSGDKNNLQSYLVTVDIKRRNRSLFDIGVTSDGG